MSDASLNTASQAAAAQTGEAGFRDFFALLKPRVMTLVVFTALVGLLAAPVAVHPVVGLAAILLSAVGGGAAGALNMWWESDIDAVMKRTAKRPIPAGKVTRDEAFAFGITLAVFSVVMLWLATNALAAAILAFTIFFYVVIYTIGLKRWTPQNIVIGGAAGAFPPMIGWAAATGTVSIESVLMFALIFMWTPPHFWALALFMRGDYDTAGGFTWASRWCSTRCSCAMRWRSGGVTRIRRRPTITASRSAPSGCRCGISSHISPPFWPRRRCRALALGAGHEFSRGT